MFKSKRATSIVEVLVIMLIIIIGVVGMYSIFGKGQSLSNTTENRIQAISIAREGLESMINIRDTNNLVFSANYINCWNNLNYDGACVTTPINDTSTDIGIGSYKIFKNTDNRWYLEKFTGSENSYFQINYRNFFKVGVDSDGLYTQSGGTDIKPLFTREIKINYIDTNSSASSDTNDEKMQVTSLVQWSDSSKTGILKVELSTILTNLKK